MATNTMDAIKKKMQAMKGEKDNALEKADQLEQRVSEQKAINEKVPGIYPGLILGEFPPPKSLNSPFLFFCPKIHFLLFTIYFLSPPFPQRK